MGAAMNARDEAKDKAARRRRDKKTEDEHVSFKGYINFSPSEQQRAHFQGWCEQEEVVHDALSDALNRGYSITLKGNVHNNAYMASASRWEARYADAGYIHTERSRDPFRALLRLGWYMAQIAYDGLPIDESEHSGIDEW